MRPIRSPLIALLAAVLLTASTAFAFSRNLSGSWTTPHGKTVVILHKPSTSQAIFTCPNLSSDLPITSLDFKGSIEGADGSTRFKFAGTAEDIAVRRGNGTCTFSDLLLATEGQLLGQFPERTLNMTQCAFMGSIRCETDNGQVKSDIFVNECSGIWR